MTVVRETRSVSAIARSLGSRAPTGMRPSTISSRIASAKPVVGRAAATGCAPVAELAGQKVHIERSGGHFNRHLQASMHQLAIEKQAS